MRAERRTPRICQWVACGQFYKQKNLTLIVVYPHGEDADALHVWVCEACEVRLIEFVENWLPARGLTLTPMPERAKYDVSPLSAEIVRPVYERRSSRPPRNRRVADF